MDILEEIGLVNVKPVDTPMNPNAKLLSNQGEPFPDPGRYRRLVGKLNYLTVTRPNIFAVNVVSISIYLVKDTEMQSFTL